MTKTELRALRNVIRRLREENCGCSPDTTFNATTREIVRLADTIRGGDHGSATVEIVSRIYLDTWIIPALELLLDTPDRNPQLAADLAGH